jgi:hypothetical protein
MLCERIDARTGQARCGHAGLQHSRWQFNAAQQFEYALRHSHASALIASGIDPLTVSRRIGHGSPVVTLRTYSHLFERTDEVAANAIEAALRTGKERRSYSGANPVPIHRFEHRGDLLSA